MTLCEHLEAVELGQEIEEACCRAVRTAMRELSEPGPEVHLPREEVEQALTQIESLRPTAPDVLV
ncbi:MAG: hypothetical protein ACRD0C_22010 [Acidimicrobiia bacterium]